MAELTREMLLDCLDDANLARKLRDLLNERGYKIVPIEPTYAMAKSVNMTADANAFRAAYHALLNAAPDPFKRSETMTDTITPEQLAQIERDLAEHIKEYGEGGMSHSMAAMIVNLRAAWAENEKLRAEMKGYQDSKKEPKP